MYVFDNVKVNLVRTNHKQEEKEETSRRYYKIKVK